MPTPEVYRFNEGTTAKDIEPDGDDVESHRDGPHGSEDFSDIEMISTQRVLGVLILTSLVMIIGLRRNRSLRLKQRMLVRKRKIGVHPHLLAERVFLSKVEKSRGR
jgi:hypothetical protein